MELNKVKSYINFAKRSKSIVFGVDDIIKSNKIKIIVLSGGLADNSKQKIDKISQTKNILKVELDKNLFFELIQNDSIKIFAITDASLAKAIKLNLLTEVSNGGNLE